MELPGYQLMERVGEDEDRVLYRLRSLNDRRIVMCMMPRDPNPGDRARALYKHEYELLRAADGNGAVQPLSLHDDQGRPLLLVEDCGGVPLTQLPGRDLPQLLAVAAETARSLAWVHRQGIVHQSVRPSHILVHPDTLEVKLIGFHHAFQPEGAAKLLADAEPPVLAPGSQLPYIAPEQTGRFGGRPDIRSDVYSLGVSLYEWMSGRRPFQTDDATELIYAHIADLAAPLADVNPAIPEPVADIVRQCMEKEPGLRYGSAYAVYEDLKRCLEQLSSKGTVAELAAGASAAAEQWAIPNGLYGRERESREWRRMMEEGVGLVLVSGQAGIGKTSFVREALRQRGDASLLICGKFEPDSPEIPYYAWIQAIEELVAWLLMQPDGELELWKRRIAHRIGGYEQLLIHWVPMLGLLLEEGAALQPLPLMEEKERFQQILRSFILLFAGANAQLTIFLDDLQWADEDSLQLIERLVNGQSDRLLFIGTCRDREEASEAWLNWDPASRMPMVKLERLTLGPLGREAVEALLTDTLGATRDSLGELTGLICDKTGGIPLLVRSYLQYGADQGLFNYQRDARMWGWDLQGLADMDDPLPSASRPAAGRLALLGAPTLELLAWGALVGRRFELAMLAKVTRRPPEELLPALMEAVRQGVLQYAEDKGRAWLVFLHDRLRQDCLARIPESRLVAYHYAVGQAWKATGTADSALFEAVIHLNQAGSLIADRRERLELAELNYQAGLRAMQSAAWATALRYFRESVALAGDEGWKDCFELTFQAVRQRAMCEFLCGDRNEAYELFARLLKRAEHEMDQADIYLTMIQLESNCCQQAKALELADSALKLLGVDPPRPAGALHLARRWLTLQWKLRRGPAALRQLPPIEDKRIKAILAVLTHSSNARFTAGGTGWLNSVMDVIELSLRHGRAPESVSGYAGMALMHTIVTRKYKTAYEWGRLAKELSADNPAFRTIALNGFALCVDTWTAHDPDMMEELIRNAEQAGLESASLWQAEQSVLFTVGVMLHLSRPLGETYGLLVRNAGIVCGSQDHEHLKLGAVLSATLRKLTGTQEPGDLFAQFDIHAPEFVLAPDGKTSRVVKAAVHMHTYVTSYIYGQYEEVYNSARMARQIVQENNENRANSIYSSYDMYLHLAMAELYPVVTASERKSFLAIMRRELREMKRHADRCPRNYRHKYALMSAEYARIANKPAKADKWYEEACHYAREGGFIHDLAIASENACRHNLDQGRTHLARAYISQSYQAYIQWGAADKAATLARQYRHLLFVDPSPTLSGIDYDAVMSSVQTISEEMRMDRLLVRLMRILIQNAGAEKGALVLEHEGKLHVEAQAGSGSEVQLLRLPLEAAELPHAIISYAVRTKSVVALDHACREGIFTGVPYIRDHQVKSVLCIPMLKNDRLVSLVYLENSLSAGVFTPERLDVLKLLCSQCAISIENAHLYTNAERLKQTLEEQVKERTQSLALSVRETAAAWAEASIQLDRNRIAADVHDIVGHTITSTLLQIEAAKRQMNRQPEEARTRLQGVQDMLREGLNEIRGTIHMLKGTAEKDDLSQSMLQLIETTKQHAGISVRTEIDPLIRLDRTSHHVIYHALKEGLTNGIRHGEADEFRFALKHAEGQLCFRLEDKGRGAGPIQYGFGLTAMQERVAALGGRLVVQPVPGGGCRLDIAIPYRHTKEVQDHALS